MDQKEIGLEGVAWINLGHNRDKWQAVMNTALNIHSFVK